MNNRTLSEYAADFTFGLETVPTWKIIFRSIVCALFIIWIGNDDPARPELSVWFAWVATQLILLLIFGWHLGEFLFRAWGSFLKKVNPPIDQTDENIIC